MSATITPSTAQMNGMVYARNTVPVITVSSQDEMITAELYILSGSRTPIYTANYALDFDNQATIDFRGIYDDWLASSVPTSGNLLAQAGAVEQFSIDVTGSSSGHIATYTFYVANSIFKGDGTISAFHNFLIGRFLTNQPAEKITDMDAKEWLSWYNYGQSMTLKVRFYPKTGDHADYTVQTGSSAGIFTANVSYSRLIALSAYLPDQLHPYYDLVMIDSKGSEVMTQRYIYQERTGNEKYFLFVNALGGIDTLICQGANTMQPEATFSIGRFGGQYVPVDDADNVRRWQQNLGQLPWKQRNWVHELLTAKQAAKQYDHESGNYYDIVITGMDLGMGDSGQLASGGFTYMRSDAENVIGQEERDTTLHQSVADGSQPFDDLTTQEVLAFEASQGGSGYETEAVEINATHVYVTIGGTASVYYSINGGTAVEITPASRMPVVVEIAPGDEIQFSCQDEAPDVVLNYYPTDASQQQAQQNNEL